MHAKPQLSTPSTSPPTIFFVYYYSSLSLVFLYLSFLSFFLTLQNTYIFILLLLLFLLFGLFHTKRKQKRTFKYLFIIIHINFRYLKFFVIIIIFSIVIRLGGLTWLSHCSSFCKRSCDF